MTKQEFQQRVKMNVTDNEYYNVIEPMYMNCDVDKDEFCAMWRKINRKRIAAYKVELKAKQEEEARIQRLWNVESRLFTASGHIGVNILLDEQELADIEAVYIVTYRQMLNAPYTKFYRSAAAIWNELHDYLMSV